ncbi:MAG: putative ABC transporter permease [Eubacteriales bacterium]|nr:putative ABC transporter permease [Eubacteriales bacterium]
MFEYSYQQWIFFFFIYCFFGWIWETCYVSVKQRKFVNRGFLHGPMLPIYGSGAMAVLIITLPVHDNPVAVYFVGMLGATCLEYVTGAVMESIFHVRYWDYSRVPLNLHGYICLTASVAWGVFSLAMVEYVQPFVEVYILGIPDAVISLADLVMFAVFCVDLAVSVTEALDLRTLIQKEKGRDLQLIQKSLTFVMDALNNNALYENLQSRKQEESEKLLLLKTELEQKKDALVRSYEHRIRRASRILERNPDSTFRRDKIRLEEIKRFFER